MRHPTSKPSLLLLITKKRQWRVDTLSSPKNVTTSRFVLQENFVISKKYLLCCIHNKKIYYNEIITCFFYKNTVAIWSIKVNVHVFVYECYEKKTNQYHHKTSYIFVYFRLSYYYYTSFFFLLLSIAKKQQDVYLFTLIIISCIIKKYYNYIMKLVISFFSQRNFFFFVMYKQPKQQI